MNSTPQTPVAAKGGGPISRVIGWLERIPYSVIALIARGAAFEVFWRSGSVKLDDWAGTLSLFETDYKVPLVPPHMAAYMAAGLELGGAVLILIGLGTRAVALAYLGMIAVIQVFVYPEAWPTHIQWVAFLLLLVARGPGLISLDALICRLLAKRPG
jgi:putative oxidoreductase